MGSESKMISLDEYRLLVQLDELCQTNKRLKRKIESLEKLVAEHHSFGVMLGAGPGDDCPVCMKKKEEFNGIKEITGSTELHQKELEQRLAKAEGLLKNIIKNYDISGIDGREIMNFFWQRVVVDD
jgi:DNA repair exonuclease SbcCD ATPase subunit